MVKLKKHFLILALMVFFAGGHEAVAAGELLWDYTPSDIHPTFSDIAVSDDAVYSLRIEDLGSGTYDGVVVYKRMKDGSPGWISSFPVPSPSSFDRDPKIAVHTNGVYVALATNISANLNFGNLTLVRLSPVDGSIIRTQTSNDPGFVSVSDVVVEGSGVYVSGGSSNVAAYKGVTWHVEQWDLNLSGRQWYYAADAHSANQAPDYLGPNSMIIEGSSIFLGGGHWSPGHLNVGQRIDRINKNNGTLDWVRLEAYGTGSVGPMVSDGMHLYTSAAGDYWGGASGLIHIPFSSTLDKRPLTNSAPVWSVPYANKTTALITDGTGLIRGYVAADDTLSQKMLLDVVSEADGSVTESALATGASAYVTGIATNGAMVNNVVYDGAHIYLVGSDGVPLSPHRSIMQKRNPLIDPPLPSADCGLADGVTTAIAPVPSPATPPNNLCTSGTAPTISETTTAFDWTCDGPDGVDGNADDVSCTASKSIPIAADLKVRVTGGGLSYVDITPFVIDVGEDIEFTWSSTGADTCTGSVTGDPAAGGFDTGGATSGSLDTLITEPLGGSTAFYILSCKNAYVTRLDAIEVRVNAAEVILDASPQLVSAGEQSTISWDVTGNDPATCTLVGPEYSKTLVLGEEVSDVTRTIVGESDFTMTCGSSLGNLDQVTVRVSSDAAEN